MKNTVRIAPAFAALVFAFLPSSIPAQQKAQPDPVTKETDVYCTGYISEVAPRADLQIVGGEKENTKANFAQGDVVYLNKGRDNGLQPGAIFYVIRPLGEVKHPFKDKKLGTMVKELGLLRVIEVQSKTATAEITVSCDTMTFGDMLKPYEAISSPGPRDSRPLPRYGEGSGGAKGRIVMSRNFREYVAANQIVYIDLGSKQGVNPGDYFTIYRKINNHESVVKLPRDEVVTKRSSGFESDMYHGGDFAVSATRVPEKEVRRARPDLPRKVLGELIVLKVEKGVSVALVTRTTAEVNIGDYVERTN